MKKSSLNSFVLQFRDQLKAHNLDFCFYNDKRMSFRRVKFDITLEVSDAQTGELLNYDYCLKSSSYVHDLAKALEDLHALDLAKNVIVESRTYRNPIFRSEHKVFLFYLPL